MSAKTVLSIAVIGMLAAGCTSAGLNPRQRAAILEKDLGQYQSDQQTKIDALNAHYRATYAALVADLGAAEVESRDLRFTADSQRIADQLIGGWPKAVQPTALQESFGVALAAQLKRVRDSDDEVAAQKATYAASFQALSTYLKKLDEARQSLRKLAEDNKQRRLEEHLDLLMNLVQGTLKAKK